MKKIFVVGAVAIISAMTVGATLAFGESGTSGAGGSTSGPGGSPIIRVSGATHGLPTVASNWSGYAVTTKPSDPFTYVHSTFVQPSIACNGTPETVTSNWVGLDGFNDETVEQDGTGANCMKGDGYKTARYYAWIEMYPLASVNTFAVKPGDKISASVSYAGGGRFSLTIADVTQHLSRTVTGTCTSCLRDSAEWIIERPAGCNQSETKCFLFALANFGTTTMSKNVATLQGGSPEPLDSFSNSYPIYMIQPSKRGFYALDLTSSVSSSNSFSETWEHYGKVTPITLGPDHN
ncbi:MAG: G1 family glutamic endopeptidase [Acidimicrobiales bacterium]